MILSFKKTLLDKFSAVKRDRSFRLTKDATLKQLPLGTDVGGTPRDEQRISRLQDFKDFKRFQKI